MNIASPSWARCASLLAINLLFLMVWGFASSSKILNGVSPWFGDKFGQTFLARFPGLTASFWLLAAAETAAFTLALVALLRGDFLGRRTPVWLTSTLVWSLFVFLQLGFGQWLTSEFNGAFQQFVYFGVTLVALQYVGAATSKSNPLDGSA